MEVALGYYSPEELCLKFDLSGVQLAGIQKTKEFQKSVALYKRELDEVGTEFKIKARRFASLVLEDLLAIATDDTAAHTDRIAAIKELARLAGYGKDEGTGGVNNGFVVTINMGGSSS